MIKHSIVLVPFPFDDFSLTKVRPALCLTNEIGKHDHVIIAFISSQEPDEMLESDISVKIGKSDFSGTGLSVDSVIRLHKIVTIPKNLIKRKLGALNTQKAEFVTKTLIKMFNA